MQRQDRFLAVDCAALPWLQARFPNGDAKGIQFQRILGGGEGLPQVHFSRYEPHWTEARHRHAEDEVLLIISGQLTPDGATHNAPSVLFVGRGTLYGPLTAGPEGVEFYRVAYTEELMRTSTAAKE